MNAIHPLRAIALAMCFFVFTPSYGQSRYDGDLLINAVGKTDQDAEVTGIKSAYTFLVANENHLLSKQGIELVLQNSTLNEIHLYKESQVYGSFKGKLPKGLSFNLSSAEVKKLLGKPSLSYNTGYCEFEVKGVGLSCWFENDHLSQLTLVKK